MNSFIVPATQAVPTLLIAFKDTFKAQLIKYLADEIPFKYQIVTESEMDIFDFIEQNSPDYLLIEDNFLNVGAIGFLKKLNYKKPSAKAIIHAEKMNADYLKIFLSSPAVGFIKKDCTLEEFTNCLKNIFQGQRIIFYDMKDLQKSNSALKHNLNQLDPSEFTDRQMEIWRLMKEAKTGNQIAQELNITIDTVKTHKNDMSKKLNLSSGTRLSILAIASKKSKND
jgi:two-component system, NarL family, invasion response regulator UvrY